MHVHVQSAFTVYMYMYSVCVYLPMTFSVSFLSSSSYFLQNSSSSVTENLIHSATYTECTHVHCTVYMYICTYMYMYMYVHVHCVHIYTSVYGNQQLYIQRFSRLYSCGWLIRTRLSHLYSSAWVVNNLMACAQYI